MHGYLISHERGVECERIAGRHAECATTNQRRLAPPRRLRRLASGAGSAERFLVKLKRVELPASLTATLAPLTEVVELLNKHVAKVDAEIQALAETDSQVKRLCTMPSVGPVTAAAFVATVDDASRFDGAHQLEAYVGLVPSEMSSGEKQRRGHITKTGNTRLRSLLVQVAVSTMRLRKGTTRALWEWAERLATKRGRRVAAVALARKVAGILFAMMRDATEFKPAERKEAAVAAVA